MQDMNQSLEKKYVRSNHPCWNGHKRHQNGWRNHVARRKPVNGAAHAALGIAAVTFIAPWAGLIVVADSFSKSVTGKNLWDHVNIGKKSADAEVAAA